MSASYNFTQHLSVIACLFVCLFVFHPVNRSDFTVNITGPNEVGEHVGTFVVCMHAVARSERVFVGDSTVYICDAAQDAGT